MQRYKRIKKGLVRFLPQNKLRTEYNHMVVRLKALEAQVDDSAQKLELAKSSFLKNVYHEIRTPLNAIMGFTNLLNRDHLLSDQERDEYVSMINKSSRDFLGLMDDIIQASLLEAGMIKVDKEACNINSFLEENHSFLTIRKHNAERNNVALLLSIDNKLKDKHVEIDKFRISQVLTHFIDNALKFTDRGVVEYGCKIVENALEFYVKDSSSNELSGNENLIFKSFTKLNSDEYEQGGLGLGLSICKDLVNLMNGDIWYKPNVDKGNTFYFSVPLVILSEKETTSVGKGKKESERVTAKPISVLKRQNYLAV